MNHGVVIGGSIAGLLATRVMSDSFERVTLVERDELTEEIGHRKGVPQSRQIHGMLPIGLRVHEELFPGLTQELHDEGAESFDLLRQHGIYSRYGWTARAASDVELLTFTRALFETLVRRRVLAIPNVEVIRGDARGLVMSDDAKIVTGVEVKRATGVETISADLVVDAGGRGSRAPKWMELLGFGRPAVIRVKVYQGYAGGLVRLPEGAMPEGLRALAAMPYPGHNRGGAVMPQENGTYALMACGMMRDYPPSDWEGFLDFLADAPSPLLHEIAKQAEPISLFSSYHKDGNVRTKWEELEPRPGRFIVTGDAVGSYNPVYGQGMAVAALGASKLSTLLTTSDVSLDTLPQVFQQELASLVEFAFETACELDAHFEGAEFEGVDPAHFGVDSGPQQPPAAAPADFEVDYDLHVEQLATEDPEVSLALWRSHGFMEPGLIYADEIKAKVAAWVESGNQLSNTDPARVPAPLDLSAKAA